MLENKIEKIEEMLLACAARRSRVRLLMDDRPGDGSLVNAGLIAMV